MANIPHYKALQRGAKAKPTGRAFGLTLAVLLVISCSFPSLVAPTSTVPAPPVSSATPLPPPPTAEPTSLPPSVTADMTIGCLTGPGDAYEMAVELQAGEQAEILGKSEGFWVVKTASGAECWVADQGVTTAGEIAAVPDIEPPPMPAPAAPAPPTDLQSIDALCTVDKSLKPAKLINQFHLTWQDMSNNEDGFRVYRDGDRIAELPADKTDVIDKIVASNNHAHYYYVTAYNTMGESKSDGITLTCEGAGSGGGGGPFGP